MRRSAFEDTVESLRNTKELKEPPQVKQLQEYVVLDSEAERDAKWVNMLEDLPNIIPTAMVSIYFFLLCSVFLSYFTSFEL